RAALVTDDFRPRRLLAAPGVDPRLDVGNFPTPLQFGAHGSDRLVIGLYRLSDCPIGLLGRRLQQLGNELAPILGGEVPAVDVGGDDVGVWIIRRGDVVDRAPPLGNELVGETKEEVEPALHPLPATMGATSASAGGDRAESGELDRVQSISPVEQLVRPLA